MNSTERVLAVLSGEIPDRVPIFEYLIHDELFKKAGYPDIKAKDQDAYLSACSKFLDICHPSVGAPFVPGAITHGDGSKTISERWTTWKLPPRNVSLTEGEILRRAALETDKLEAKQPLPDYNAMLAEKRRRTVFTGGMLYIEIGVSCALPYDNTEQSVYLFTDHPELVERRMSLQNKRTMERLQAIAYPELSPVAIIWDDIAYKNSLLYPPDLLDRLFFPTLWEICDLLHSRGIKIIFHSDGDNVKAMPSLIKCGIDGFNPLEITAGMDVKSFKQKYGKRVAIVGGMDAVSVLALGTVDEVVAETKRLIDIGGAGGGLIAASASGQIDDSMPQNNIVAFFETVHDYGRYK